MSNPRRFHYKPDDYQPEQQSYDRRYDIYRYKAPGLSISVNAHAERNHVHVWPETRTKDSRPKSMHNLTDGEVIKVLGWYLA